MENGIDGVLIGRKKWQNWEGWRELLEELKRLPPVLLFERKLERAVGAKVLVKRVQSERREKSQSNWRELKKGDKKEKNYNLKQKSQLEQIYHTARLLIPWRKGPFQLKIQVEGIDNPFKSFSKWEESIIQPNSTNSLTGNLRESGANKNMSDNWENGNNRYQPTIGSFPQPITPPVIQPTINPIASLMDNNSTVLKSNYSSRYSKRSEFPFEFFIESEWDSSIKWNLIAPYIEIAGKKVVDIGCNNGYYLFQMGEMGAERLVGFDPSPLFYLQFRFINHFLQLPIEYYLLGVEDLVNFGEKWDLILCMGVLYHRPNPIETLKFLRRSLTPKGKVILDTLIIPGEEPVALTPYRYAKMKNVYFIPTLPGLKNWVKRAGFTNWKVIAIRKTDFQEQRQTEWIKGESLESFIKPDLSQTVEGFPPPTRAYLLLS